MTSDGENEAKLTVTALGRRRREPADVSPSQRQKKPNRHWKTRFVGAQLGSLDGVRVGDALEALLRRRLTRWSARQAWRGTSVSGCGAYNYIMGKLIERRSARDGMR